MTSSRTNPSAMFVLATYPSSEVSMLMTMVEVDSSIRPTADVAGQRARPTRYDLLLSNNTTLRSLVECAHSIRVSFSPRFRPSVCFSLIRWVQTPFSAFGPHLFAAGFKVRHGLWGLWGSLRGVQDAFGATFRRHFFAILLVPGPFVGAYFGPSDRTLGTTHVWVFPWHSFWFSHTESRVRGASVVRHRCAPHFIMAADICQ